MENQRLQEIFLLLGDKAALINKKWWYALAITVVATIPLFYLVRFGFVKLLVHGYTGPKIIYTSVVKEPLEVIDAEIFSLPNNTYSGFAKIKNINLEWGVGMQNYTAQFKTYGGTVLSETSGSGFVLPASEKLIIFPRFASDKKPDELVVTLGQTQFVHKPEVAVNLELQRISLQNNSDGLVISAGIKNLTAFTISQINLPVVVYNAKNEIIGVNFTYINQVQSGETRTFQYTWPAPLAGAVRAEISPEVNIFDRNLFSNPAGVSPFNNQSQ